MSVLLIQGGRILDPARRFDAPGDVLVREGQVVELGPHIAAADAQVIGASGLVVAPGLQDCHVHFRQPGQEDKETIATGSRAAAAGGFTAVVCEPNTVPPLDNADGLSAFYRAAQRDSVVRAYTKACITRRQEGMRLTDFEALAERGAVAFSDDGRAVESREVMRAALEAARGKYRLTVHVDEPDMVARDIELAAETGCALHFSHISLAESARLIRAAKARGIPITAEVTPHHLALCADDVPAGDANFRVTPPLRSRQDMEAVRQALAEGVIDVIASDHAPHTPEEKARGWEDAPPGMVGLECALGVALMTMVHGHAMSLTDVVAKMTSCVAPLLGIPGGALRPGAPADITIFDPDAGWVVEPTRFHSKGRNCPFAGRTLRGRPVITIVGGRLVMCGGEVPETARPER